MEKLLMQSYGFTLESNNAYCTLYLHAPLKLAVCVANSEYIPIDHFKSIFEEVSDIADRQEIQSFLFDKRQLRTFHQPSMEWYFTVWKPHMKEKGLTQHFKILPELDWFVKSVEAGKHEIFQKFGKEVIHGISIQYVTSLEEVIEKVKKS